MDQLFQVVQPRPRLFIDPNEEICLFKLTEDEPYPTLVYFSQAIPWCPRFATDDEAGPQADFYLGREDLPPKEMQSVPWAARTFLDDEISPQNFWLEQEETWQVSIQSSMLESLPWLSRNSLDDEILQPGKRFFLEDEMPWIGRVESYPWLPRPFLDDEISTSLLNFFLDYHEDWNKAVESYSWLSLPFRDDEASAHLGNLFLEDERAWVQPTQMVPWTGFIAIDDEIMYSVAIDEVHWTAQVQYTPWLSIIQLSDEINAQNFHLEQEEPWIQRAAAQPWLAVPSLDDEIGASLTHFYLEDELDIIGLLKVMSLPVSNPSSGQLYFEVWVFSPYAPLVIDTFDIDYTIQDTPTFGDSGVPYTKQSFFVGDVKRFNVSNWTLDGSPWPISSAVLTLVDPSGVAHQYQAVQLSSTMWYYDTRNDELSAAGTWRVFWTLSDGSITLNWRDEDITVLSVT